MRASLALVAVVVLLRSWYLPAAALGITIPLTDLVLRLQDLFLHLFGVFHFLLLFVLLLLAFSSSCLRLRLCFRRLALAESDMPRMQGREDGVLSRSQSLAFCPRWANKKRTSGASPMAFRSGQLKIRFWVGQIYILGFF